MYTKLFKKDVEKYIIPDVPVDDVRYAIIGEYQGTNLKNIQYTETRDSLNLLSSTDIDLVGVLLPPEILRERYKKDQIVMLFERETVGHEDPGYDPYWAGYISYHDTYNYLGISDDARHLAACIEERNGEYAVREAERRKEMIDHILKTQKAVRIKREKEKAVIPYRMTVTMDHIEQALLGNCVWTETEFENGFKIKNSLRVEPADDYVYTTKVWYDLHDNGDTIYQKIKVSAWAEDLKDLIRDPQSVIDLINDGDKDGGTGLGCNQKIKIKIKGD